MVAIQSHNAHKLIITLYVFLLQKLHILICVFGQFYATKQNVRHNVLIAQLVLFPK